MFLLWTRDKVNSSVFLSFHFGDKLESWMVRYCEYMHVTRTDIVCVCVCTIVYVCSPNPEIPEIIQIIQPRKMETMVSVQKIICNNLAT